MDRIIILMACSFFVNAGVTCKQFNSWQDAQAYFEAKKPGYRNLDRNHDGEACQNMSHKAKEIVEYNLETYVKGVFNAPSRIYSSLEDCRQAIKKLQDTVKNKNYSYKCIKK